MKWKIKIFTFVLMISFSGCNIWIAPPYTNVERLYALQIGMSLDEVNSLLRIEPYDIYFISDDNYIVIYNYRVKDRMMKISDGDYQDAIHTDSSQIAGKDWYGERYVCYIYFVDKKVKSIITDNGKNNSENILIKNNNIFLIQKDQLGFFQTNDTIIIVPVN